MLLFYVEVTRLEVNLVTFLSIAINPYVIVIVNKLGVKVSYGLILLGTVSMKSSTHYDTSKQQTNTS